MPSRQPAGRRRYENRDYNNRRYKTSYAFSGRPVMRMPE